MRRRDSHDGQGRGGAEDQDGRRGGRGQAGVRQGSRRETGGETGVMTPLPVFLFPSELVFYSEQRSSHRRVLTLYNPYSFRISFKMLCTAPSLYRVVEAEGSVRPKSCVDLVVRHLDVSPRNWGRRDRFRMEIRGGGQVGGREIWAELRGGGEDEEEEERRRKKQEGVGEEKRTRRQQRVLSPLLVPTYARLQLPTCTAARWFHIACTSPPIRSWPVPTHWVFSP